MNRLAILLALFFVLPLAMLAEDNDLKKLLNKYKNVPGFDLELTDPDINLDLDGDWNFGDFLNEVNKVYVLDFDKKKGDHDDFEEFNSKLNKLIGKKGFKTMVDIDGEGSVKILTRKSENDKPTDYLIVTEDEDDAVVIWASSD